MIKQKSQAAMEFLMTYGWALLVVIIALGAILFFVGNPYIFFPDKVDFGPGLHVPGFTYAYFEMGEFNMGNFELYIKNGFDKKMIDTSLTIDQCNNSNGKSTEKFDILPGKTKRIILTCENINTNQNGINKFNGTLDFDQKTDQQVLHHKRIAEIIVNPKDMVDFPDNNKGRRAFALRNGASGEEDENRYYPCDDVPDCNNPDPTGVIKTIFGGYVDSVTGKVWSDESSNKLLNWSTQASVIWDDVYYEWDYKNKKYVREDIGGSSRRDDILGAAFTYCIDLNENGKSDWKLTSVDDYDGLTTCNQCLPPFGTYGISGGLGDSKYYWTEDAYINYGQSTAIKFVDETVSIGDSFSRQKELAVRCIRDD